MKADRADIEALTEMRLEYIKADMGVSIVPLAVIFIERRIREKEKETERRIQDSEARTSSSNLALLEEVNNFKYKDNFASETTLDIAKDEVYRYICIIMTTSTKEIIEHFKSNYFLLKEE